MIAMFDPGHSNFGKIIVTFNKFPLNLGQSVVLTLLTKHLAANWMVSIYLDSDWSFLPPYNVERLQHEKVRKIFMREIE